MKENRPKIGVTIATFSSDCSYVLMSKRKNVYGAGAWQFPGGSMEYGEDPIACARRELKEETNLTLCKPRDWGWCNTIDPKTRTQFVDIMISGKARGQLKTMEPDKCEGWEWVPVSDVLSIKKPLHITLWQCLKKFDLYLMQKCARLGG